MTQPFCGHWQVKAGSAAKRTARHVSMAATKRGVPPKPRSFAASGPIRRDKRPGVFPIQENQMNDDPAKTTERRDALWRMYESNVSQSQHHEKQRARIVRVIFTINVALIGLITFDRSISGLGDALAAIFLFATGLFGAGFTYKTHERSAYHFSRARAFRDRIDTCYLDGEIAAVQGVADSRHDAEFGWIRRARLHRWWVTMNLTAAAIGAALAIVAVLFPIMA